MWADEKGLEVASHICGEMLRSQRGEHKHKNQNKMQLMHRGMRNDASVDVATHRSDAHSEVGRALFAAKLALLCLRRCSATQRRQRQQQQQLR